MKQFSYQISDELKTVTIEQVGDRFRVSIGERVYDVAARQHQPGEFDLEVEGQQWRGYVAGDGSRRYVAIAGETWVLENPRPGQQRQHGFHPAADSGRLEATMPGLVRELLAVEGAAVKRGDTLVVLEAMKMELRLSAPYTGRVRRVHCAAGQVVERGQVLVELEGDDAS
jgi:acetyl/propionyl-CoA carboxylase alpha subunit